MYKMNTKLLVLGCLVMGISDTVFAWKVEIENGTDEEISGNIDLKVCKDKKFKLNVRGGFLKIGTGICCIRGFNFRGERSGLEGRYDPTIITDRPYSRDPRDLSGGCKNVKFTIKKSDDGKTLWPHKR